MKEYFKLALFGACFFTAVGMFFLLITKSVLAFMGEANKWWIVASVLFLIFGSPFYVRMRSGKW